MSETQPHACIELQEPSATYVAGDTVKGVLRIATPADGFAADQLALVLSGVEKCRFKLTRAAFLEARYEGAWEPESDGCMLFEDEAEFAHEVYPIPSQQAALPAGQHAFRFSFRLPASLRGSWKDKQGVAGRRTEPGGFRGIARYRLTFDHVGTRLSCKAKLLVHPLPPHTAGDPLTAAFPAAPRLRATMTTDRQAYAAGETVVVSVSVSSTRESGSRRSCARLVRTLDLAVGRTRKSVATEVLRLDMPGFGPCYLGTRTFALQLPEAMPPSAGPGRLATETYAVCVALYADEEPRCEASQRIVVLGPESAARRQLQGQQQEQRQQRQVGEVLRRRPWQADGDSSACSLCEREFTVMNRRHHCRHCGKLFCGYCTSKRSAIANQDFATPVRVCETCYTACQAGGDKLEIVVDP
eukprot:m51a1_g7710 hypothetical protein (413) ;mRNA; r:105990-107598